MTQQWVTDPAANKGVICIATNEDDPGYDIRFHSSEYSNSNYRPYLDITYKHAYNKNYYLKDHPSIALRAGFGNICVTINENGDVQGYDDYYPFGLQMPGRSGTGAIPNDMYKFSGKELDQEGGLDWYYFGARYYDPAIGRWGSVDPLAFKYPAHSPYNYVLNNPLNMVDPDGRGPGGVIPLPGIPFIPPIPSYGSPAFNGPGQLALKIYRVLSNKIRWITLPDGRMVPVFKTTAEGESNSAANNQTESTLADPNGNNGKKAEDSSKNEKHGDRGKAESKADKQIKELEKQLESATKKQKKKIKHKIQNIKNDAAKKAKGEEHSRTNKR